MTPRTKKKLFDLFRLLACGGALWIVVRSVSLDDRVHLREGGAPVTGKVLAAGEEIIIELAGGEERVLPREAVAANERGEPRIHYGLKAVWRNSRKSLLLLALIIHVPVIFLQSLRFQWLLHAQRIALHYGNSLKLCLAGNFLNFATPLGSNAGDVFKAYFLALHTERKTEAVTTVFLDRAIGLASLLLVAAAITTFSRAGPLALLRPYLLLMLGAGVLVIVGYFLPPLRQYVIPRLERWPIGMHLRRMDSAAHSLAAHKRIILSAVLLTVLLQGIAVGAYFTLALALGMKADMSNVLEYYAYFYTGVVVQALPGPPQGLGTVELAYLYFFHSYGSPSQIVCLAFAVRLLSLVCSLPGLLVTLTGSYKPRELSHRAAPASPELSSQKHATIL